MWIFNEPANDTEQITSLEPDSRSSDDFDLIQMLSVLELCHIFERLIC